MTAANQVNWFGKNIRHTASVQTKNRLAATALIVIGFRSYDYTLSLPDKSQLLNYGLRIYPNQMALHFLR